MRPDRENEREALPYVPLPAEVEVLCVAERQRAVPDDDRSVGARPAPPQRGWVVANHAEACPVPLLKHDSGKTVGGQRVRVKGENPDLAWRSC